MEDKICDFGQALVKLNIEDYQERIFNSNSHGELIHLYDYIVIANALGDAGAQAFRTWFESVVKWAEENWQRPESIFQHIRKILIESVTPAD